MDLESKRLILKEISWDDLEDIHRLHSFPEVDEFNTLGLPNNIEETKEVIRPVIEGQTKIPRKSYTWKIVLQDSNDFVGIAGMSLSCDKFKCISLKWGRDIFLIRSRTNVLNVALSG
jgi:hypothetical protein